MIFFYWGGAIVSKIPSRFFGVLVLGAYTRTHIHINIVRIHITHTHTRTYITRTHTRTRTHITRLNIVYNINLKTFASALIHCFIPPNKLTLINY